MLFSALLVPLPSIQVQAQHTSSTAAPSAASVAAPAALGHLPVARTGTWMLQMDEIPQWSDPLRPLVLDDEQDDISANSITRMAAMKEAIV